MKTEDQVARPEPAEDGATGAVELFFCGEPDPLAATQELTNRVDASSADPVMTVVR